MQWHMLLLGQHTGFKDSVHAALLLWHRPVLRVSEREQQVWSEHVLPFQFVGRAS